MQAPEDQPIKPDTKQLIHKSLLSFTRYFFPSVEKIHSSDTPNEAALLARALCEAASGGTRNDDGRAFVIAESSSGPSWTSTGVAEDGTEKGRMEVTGTIRGGCLSANRLLHIPGAGDYQIESVSSITHQDGMWISLTRVDQCCRTLVYFACQPTSSTGIDDVGRFGRPIVGT
jgi:pre-rRNA-processing protein TSR1